MVRRIKKKDHEKLSSANISHVISLLEPEKGQPISKKEACDILNIAYNTTRLNRIIEEYKDQQIFVAKRKSQNRGRAATKAEIQQVVTEYLQGDTISSIAKGLYRSPGFVKAIIERVGVPQVDKSSYCYLPDECVSDSFIKGQRVWSAKYQAPAIVKEELSVDYQAEKPGFEDTNYEKKYSSKCYSIYVFQEVKQDSEFFMGASTGGFNGYALACELGSLEHLKEYGVDLTKL